MADWWKGRSVVDFVAACQVGEAPRDSILDPEPTPEQVALARTTEQLNDLAWRMRTTWTLERFQEKFRENFPLMR